MKRILLLIFICCQCLSAVAQKNAPKWIDKAKKAVFTITTYGKDGNQLSTGNGFFISESGEALSSYTLFKGAFKATVTDTEGKTFPVASILGADELYDVVKFQVSIPKKIAFLPVAADPVANGTVVYLLPYSTGKNAAFSSGAITEVSKLKDPYNYYKLAIPLESAQLNAPLLTPEGQVLGLAQADASGKKDISYGLSAAYANSLAITSADFLNTVYTNIGIKRGWPKEIDQATVALYLINSMQDAKKQLETVNDFIASFPNSSEGYLSRASLYAYNRSLLAATPAEEANYLTMAFDDIHTASKFDTKTGEVYYNQAKLIFGVASGDTTLNNPAWTMDAAMEAIQKAIKEEDQPAYQQLLGDLYFNQQQYQQAYDTYMIVNNSELASSGSYYFAAKAKENISGFNIGDVIALLDKAIEKCGTSMPPEAGTYILERIDWKLRLSQYAEAVADYNLYETLLTGQISPNFYFLREQAKFRAGDLEGALADIQEAIHASPQTPDYYAEEASVYVRLQKYQEALESIKKAIEIAPDFAACYRLRGVCYVRLEKKAEACEALNKAKELGDPVADKLIKEHCK